MKILAAQSSLMRGETPRRFRPPLSRERFRRSVSTAPGHQVSGLAALARASALSLLSCSRPMSRSVGKPLPNNASQRALGPLNIVNAKREPFVVAELALCEIPLEMLFADVVIDANN